MEQLLKLTENLQFNFVALNYNFVGCVILQVSFSQLLLKNNQQPFALFSLGSYIAWFYIYVNFLNLTMRRASTLFLEAKFSSFLRNQL